MARDRLAAAEVLLREGFLRDAASRAYYAMYHAAYALARLEGEAPTTHRGLSHILYEAFLDDGALTRAHLSSFRRGQEIREMGDYEILFSLGEQGVADLIEQARTFIDAAEAELKS